jgi:tetratricopeptide (TPR) repeat protein
MPSRKSLLPFVLLAAFMSIPAPLPAQAFSLRASPALDIPLADSAAVFTLGGTLNIAGEYAFGGTLPLFLLAGATYDLSPIQANVVVHSLSATVGAGAGLELVPRLGASAFLSAGYYYSFFNDTGTLRGGGNPVMGGGVRMHYMLTPLLDIGLGVSYKNLIGLYGGLEVVLGTSLYFSGIPERQAKIESTLRQRPQLLRAPEPDKGIKVVALSLKPVFPVFRNYYDDHSIGTVTLLNQEKGEISSIKGSFYIKKYMDNPRTLEVPATLAPGQSVDVDLFALLNSGVMDITEGEKASAELSLEYSVKEERYADSRVSTVVIHNRNAMTWEDDRRAAAFVTRFDPLIQEYAKNLLGVVDGLASEIVGRKLLAAIAAHQTLGLAGLKYTVDPKSSYVDKASAKKDVDYLQFPRQTLLRKGGDCDDLSILYCALLEAVGVEAAFVTVPGHIFMAFSPDIDPAAVSKTFSQPQDFFIRDGAVWVPIEVTERNGGFLKAWRLAAQEWRQAESAGSLGFYPLGDAWKTYAPVQSPETSGESVTVVTLPAVRDIADSVQKELQAFKQIEVETLAASLMKKLDSRKGDPVIQNKLGILYARYGFTDRAEAEFRKLTAGARPPYVPALINLGNLSYLKGDYPQALRLYSQAEALEPGNANAQLCVARACFALERYDDARAAFAQARQADPKLAEHYSFLGQEDGSGERASSAADAKGSVLWDE